MELPQLQLLVLRGRERVIVAVQAISSVASEVDITRLLNLGTADSSALVEVIAEYFADRHESDVSSEDKFRESQPQGMSSLL